MLWTKYPHTTPGLVLIDSAVFYVAAYMVKQFLRTYLGRYCVLKLSGPWPQPAVNPWAIWGDFLAVARRFAE